eukprot:gene44123-58844_t
MAEDGREAVDTDMCNPGVYDIIFMDNLMPNMNGVEATKILRQEGYDRIIVGVTGCALDDDFFAYTNAGADIVLSKTLDDILLRSTYPLCWNATLQSLFDDCQLTALVGLEILKLDLSHLPKNNTLYGRGSDIIVIRNLQTY